MNATKNKILEKSLNLFNEHGLPNVSQRNIAESLGMSPGNLTYHFNKKHLISERLYKSFASELEHIGVKDRDVKNPLLDCIVLFENTYELCHKYRFLLFDFMYLIKSSDKLTLEYSELWTHEKYRIIKNVNDLVLKGVLRPERFETEYSHYLNMKLMCFTQAFISCTQALGNYSEGKKEYVHHMMVCLFPFLTKKGEKLFKTLDLDI